MVTHIFFWVLWFSLFRFFFHFSIYLELILMYDVPRDLIKYFHPKSSPIAPVMLPSSTGVMTVFAHTAFLCIDWARGVLVLLLLPTGGLRCPWMTSRDPISEIHIPRLSSPSTSSRSYSFPISGWRQHPTVRDRHTCSYQQLEEILGCFWVLGKLLENKDRAGPLHVWDYRQEPSRVVTSQLLWGLVSLILSVGNLPWWAFFSPHLQACTDVQNDYRDMLCSKISLESLSDLSKKVPAISRSSGAIGAFLKVQILKKKLLWV